MAAKLDAIIFGATGFTGQIVVENALEILKDYKWGIAGRNREKLQNVLKEVGKKAGKDLSNIPIILADVQDYDSLYKMAMKCRIVLNCCGPYRLYGEVVVKACLAAGSHHVDLSGEPEYIAKMQLEYNALAEEKGVYVVSTCAFESIPAEMGVLFAAKNFEGTINSIEMYHEYNLNYQDKSSKAILNSGTWESAVFAFQHIWQMLAMQFKLNRAVNIPSLRPKLRTRLLAHRTEGLSSYFIPFPNIDRATVQRTQSLMYMKHKKRPIQVENYMGFKSLLIALLLPFYTFFLIIMSQIYYTRNLLLKYPKFFTLGLMTAEGPKEINRKAVEFTITLKAKGWQKNTSEIAPINKQLTVQITGKDPAYGATSNILLCCAKVILQEYKNMPRSGGVLPPGMAFANTQLIEELSRVGLKFKVIKDGN